MIPSHPRSHSDVNSNATYSSASLIMQTEILERKFHGEENLFIENFL